MPKLIVTEKGGEKQRVVGFSREGISIGRAEENAVSLPTPGISRKHATIVVSGNNYFLSDLGSGNGTFLNGTRLTPNEQNLLRHGDLISIENYNLSFNQIDEMLASSFNEITDSDILEVKLLKRVLKAIDKEKVPSLEVLNGNFVGKKFFVPDDATEITFGRDASAGFQIEEHVISRQHAKIVKVDKEIIIQDLNSKNGVFVNNRRVTEDAVHDGDRIALGTIVLIFRNPKEVSMDEISEQVKRERALKKEEEAPVEEESPEAIELRPMPDEYPTPVPRKERITLSFFEMGMIGLGVLIFVFAAISLINLLTR